MAGENAAVRLLQGGSVFEVASEYPQQVCLIGAVILDE